MYGGPQPSPEANKNWGQKLVAWRDGIAAEGIAEESIAAWIVHCPRPPVLRPRFTILELFHENQN